MTIVTILCDYCGGSHEGKGANYIEAVTIAGWFREACKLAFSGKTYKERREAEARK